MSQASIIVQTLPVHTCMMLGPLGINWMHKYCSNLQYKNVGYFFPGSRSLLYYVENSELLYKYALKGPVEILQQSLHETIALHSCLHIAHRESSRWSGRSRGCTTEKVLGAIFWKPVTLNCWTDFDSSWKTTYSAVMSIMWHSWLIGFEICMPNDN